jgi:hypothetical protein
MIRSKKETQALEVEKNIATQQFRKSVICIKRMLKTMLSEDTLTT